MNAPDDLVAIPPLGRTVIYYLLAISLVVCGAVVGGTRDWALALVITSGLSGVFFGTAAARVNATPKAADPETDPVTGYGSGV